MAEEQLTTEAYFQRERDAFVSGAARATRLSHLIGNRETDSRCVWASWLFMRLCVTAKSVERLFEPQPSGYGELSYLDHASIASLARGLIENAAVLLYLGDKGDRGCEQLSSS